MALPGGAAAAPVGLVAGVGLSVGGLHWLRREYPKVVSGMEKRDEVVGRKIVPVLFPVAGAAIVLSGLGLLLASSSSLLLPPPSNDNAPAAAIVAAATSCVAAFPETFVPCLPTMHSKQSPSHIACRHALISSILISPANCWLNNSSRSSRSNWLLH